MTETEPTPEQTQEPETAEPTEEDVNPSSGVGALLRASRLRCGEDLRDVAHSLKIRYAFLDAIEAGRFADLPGPAYAAGFVRSYADYLGLDSEEVVRRFKKEAVPTPQHRSHLDFPSPVSESGTPKAAILFFGLLIAMAGYGGWYVMSGKSGLLGELVTPVPEEMTKPAEPVPAPEKPMTTDTAATGDDKSFHAAPALEPKPVIEPSATEPQPQPVQAEAPKPAEPAAPAPLAEKPVDANKTKAEQEAKAKAEQEAKDKAEQEAKAKAEQEAKAKAEQEAKDKAQAAAAPVAAEAAPAGSRVFGAPESEVARVVIKATSDSWIQIRDEGKNQTVATRVLRAGDSYRVPTQAGLKLATGNAGALEIRVDGQVVPSVGAPGMVRRGIVLDPDRLKSGTAVDSAGN
jgi:cytoskeleton protein RodZ